MIDLKIIQHGNAVRFQMNSRHQGVGVAIQTYPTGVLVYNADNGATKFVLQDQIIEVTNPTLQIKTTDLITFDIALMEGVFCAQGLVVALDLIHGDVLVEIQQVFVPPNSKLGVHVPRGIYRIRVETIQKVNGFDHVKTVK